MGTTQQAKRKNNKRLVGVGLLVAPFAGAIIAAIGLYAWIVINGYQGSESVAYAWFVYALVFLSYYGIPLLGLGLAAMIAGIVLLVTKK